MTAVAVRVAGGSFLLAFLALLVALFMGFVTKKVWNTAVKPTGKKLRENGLVGVGESFFERFLRPILYGKKRKRQ
jgi:hypothetical protein